jgi:transposase
MLNLTAAKIYLCLDPTDMRKSFDTLAALVREHLNGDPQSGSWFVFRGKRGDRLKILYWDRDGYAVWQKRLEAGTFEFPKVIGGAAGVTISATELSLILGGVALNARRRMRYAKPAEESPEK